MLDPSQYTIGWVCALPCELFAAKLHLDEKHNSDDYAVEARDDNTYVFGRIGKHNLVIATLPRGEYGVSSAANVARDMVRSFTNIRVGFMVGIGGGAPLMEDDDLEKRDIRLGDVVVSVPGKGFGGVHPYRCGKDIQDQPYLVTGHMNSPPASILGAVTVLGAEFDEEGQDIDGDVTSALKNCQPKTVKQYQRPPSATDHLYKPAFLHSDSSKGCSNICTSVDGIVQRPDRDEEDEKVVIHYGLIGSADTLMKNATMRNALARESDVLCFEMEAAGLMNRMPFLIVRGICDYADTHKNKRWQGYAAMTAAAYTKRLLLRLHPTRVEAESRLSELKEIKEHLQAISSKVTDTHSHVVQYTTTALQAKVVKWLAAPNPWTNLNSARDLREPGTGDWLAEVESYLEWKRGDIRHLWLQGKAGCGKTVISSTIIEDVQSMCDTDSDLGYAFFYFSFSDSSKQSYVDCLRSLVYQISRNEIVTSALQLLYERSRDQPDMDLRMEDELQKILIDKVQGYDRFYLILDALDESPDITSGGKNQRDVLLKWLCRLSSELPKLQILATSRKLPDIEKQMLNLGCREQLMIEDCINVDIKSYVTSQLKQDSRLSKLNDTLTRKIQDVFDEKADGMFRWAYCQMNELKDLPSAQPSDIEDVLNSLPESLDEIYNRVLNRIQPRLHEKVLNLLRWLTYSHRPLTLFELSETRVIKLHTIEGEIRDGVETDDRGNPEDILTMLSGLVATFKPEFQRSDVEESDYEEPVSQISRYRHGLARPGSGLQVFIRLAHFSVREYLETSQESTGRPTGFYFKVEREHQLLSHYCIAYLTHYAGVEGYLRAIHFFPFLDYSARFWFRHCQETDDIQREVAFLQSKTACCSWLTIYDPYLARWKGQSVLDTEEIQEATGLHLAAFLGLSAVANGMIKAGVNLDGETGADHGTVLQGASKGGHASIVKMLLEAGANINDITGRSRGNALEAAVSGGHDSIVKMLLDAGADTNVRTSGFEGSALRMAAMEGYDSIVKMLLDAGADVNLITNGYNGNALRNASREGHDSIVKMLLDAGADVNIRTKSGITALQAASEAGHDSTVKILLAAGADVNTKSVFFGTALEAACKKGHDSIVKILLAAGADINSRNRDHGTALETASSLGRDSTVKILLDSGADVNIRGDYGTALEVASRKRHKSTVKILLAAGASPIIDKHTSQVKARRKIPVEIPNNGKEMALVSTIGVKRKREFSKATE